MIMSICVFANGQVGVSVVEYLLQNKEKIGILESLILISLLLKF